MTIWLLLAILIPTVVLIVEARPDSLDKWWCDHIHRNHGHSANDHHGVH